MTTTAVDKGTIIGGRYRVECHVGHGGMQNVYRAHDLRLNRTVAVKVPMQTSSKRRFDESARLSARILHPNVARTLDFDPGAVAGRSVLVEEFIDGVDLSELLERYGVLDPALAAHIVHHLAKAVAACHAVGVVHRDLKPSNVLVSDELYPAVVKVTDFGIAKMAEAELAEAAENEETLTTNTTAIGAIPYMAPEMIDNAGDATAAADVWSLGALLYHLISGKRPFGSGLKAVKRITDDGFVPEMPCPRSNDPKFKVLFEELSGLVARCLLRDPAERPTAANVVNACQRMSYQVDKRRVGVVQRILGSGLRAFGFLADASTGHEIFFHLRSYYGENTHMPGRSVAYAAFPGSPQPRAYPVVPLSSSA